MLLTTWVLTACDENTVYHSYQSTPPDGWKKSDTLFFNVPLKDSLANLRLSVGVRNSSNYPYQNLNILIHYNLEDSTIWKTDTLKFILNRLGKSLPIGTPFEGLLCQTSRQLYFQDSTRNEE